MSRAPVVVVTTGHALAVVDYRSGRVELHGTLPTVPAVHVVRRPGPRGSWGTGEVEAVLPPTVPVGPLWRAVALVAIACTGMAAICGTRRGRLLRMVRLAGAGRGLPPASAERTGQAVDAVRSTSSLLPGRWACLERSVAVCVALSLTGKRAEWRHGVATDPVRLHAWISDEQGRPVGEGPDVHDYTIIHTTDGPGPVPGHEPRRAP